MGLGDGGRDGVGVGLQNSLLLNNVFGLTKAHRSGTGEILITKRSFQNGHTEIATPKMPIRVSDPGQFRIKTKIEIFIYLFIYLFIYYYFKHDGLIQVLE